MGDSSGGHTTVGWVGAPIINADVERAEEELYLVASANAHMMTVRKDTFIQRVAQEHRYKVCPIGPRGVILHL
jgi:hypothetical protein